MVSTFLFANWKAIVAGRSSFVAILAATDSGAIAKLVFTTYRWANGMAVDTAVARIATASIGGRAESMLRTLLSADRFAVLNGSFVALTATGSHYGPVGSLENRRNSLFKGNFNYTLTKAINNNINYVQIRITSSS